MARRLAGKGLPFDDLTQTGDLAVVLSFRRWSPTGGANLLTWVYRCVVRGMLNALREQRRLDGKRRLRRGEDEDAGGTRVKKPAVQLLSLDDEYNELHRFLASHEEQPDFLMRECLLSAIDDLTFDEQLVIQLRFGDDVTLEAASLFFNVTKERVRQIEAVALEKLRVALKRVRA
ncbi:MAG: sigma-70 family RNA polymerase sigma factor [Polyangiaceae bacterium]|nr:sigma-70 family RNA polymerase sigma factor [Polyangiaceae bacterium]